MSYQTGIMDWSTKLLYPVDHANGWTAANMATMKTQDYLYLDTSSWWQYQEAMDNVAELRSGEHKPEVFCYLAALGSRDWRDIDEASTRPYNWHWAQLCTPWNALDINGDPVAGWIANEGGPDERVYYQWDPYLVDVDVMVNYHCQVVEDLGPNCRGVFYDYWPNVPWIWPGYNDPTYFSEPDYLTVYQNVTAEIVRKIRARLGWARPLHINGKLPLINPKVAVNPTRYGQACVFEDFRSLWWSGEAAAEQVGFVVENAEHHASRVVLLTRAGVAPAFYDRYIAKPLGDRAILVHRQPF